MVEVRPRAVNRKVQKIHGLRLCFASFSLGENIFRRSAYEAVGGYVSFPGGIGSDLTLLLKLACHGTVQTIAGPRFRFRHHAAAISSGATTYQSLAIRGLRESCLWLDAWNRQARVASSWVFRYWTMRWFHAALKHWAPALTPAQRDDLEAGVLVQMDMQARRDRAEAMVLDVGELVRERARLVVVHQREHTDGLARRRLPRALVRGASTAFDRAAACGSVRCGRRASRPAAPQRRT